MTSDFFFYPSSWGADKLINRTAHSFVRSLRSGQRYDSIKPYKNLPSCFKGKAHTWWLNQNPIIQRGLTHCGDVEQCLLKAFGLSPDETFAAFDAVRYTVRDALNRRDTKAYIHFLTSAAEQCGVPENQWASWAWQHLEQPIRRLIPKPRKGVTSRGFEDVLQKSGNTGMQSLHGMRISPAIELVQRCHFQMTLLQASHINLVLALFNPCR